MEKQQYSPEQDGGMYPNIVPPPQYHSGGPQPATTNVVVTQAAPPPLGPTSVGMVCPSCHHQVTTTISSEANSKTHLFALLLCCCLCWPCAFLPYCMDSCQSQIHTCPNCKAYLGTYQN